MREKKEVQSVVSGHKDLDAIIQQVNQETSDVLYISDFVHIPNEKNIRRLYREDFTLVQKKDLQAICTKDKNIQISEHATKSDFFVYNERKHLLIPFKKNDYLMDKDGYLTFD